MLHMLWMLAAVYRNLNLGMRGDSCASVQADL